ncbi:hypothetical protein ACFL1R_10370, partial [Candidatus Latescibacterota bacterium]
MKQSLNKVWIILIFFVFFSCSSSRKLIRNQLNFLDNKKDITIVLFGDSISIDRWRYNNIPSYGKILKPQLKELLDKHISFINTSLPDETFGSAKRRIQEDIF